MNKGLFQALFAPRVVALVGASGEAGKNTARPQRFLASIGYSGTVVPIRGGFRVGYLQNADYIVWLIKRNRKGIHDTARRIMPRLNRILRG